MKNAYTIGIDEVGRGALAGPVTVAVALVPIKINFKKLKDSKKLSTLDWPLPWIYLAPRQRSGD